MTIDLEGKINKKKKKKPVDGWMKEMSKENCFPFLLVFFFFDCSSLIAHRSSLITHHSSLVPRSR